MSQHYFRTTLNAVPVVVTLGYDRPLDFVFMTVLAEADEDDVIYSNLLDPTAGTTCGDVNYYRPILKRLGLSVPETVFSDVVRDQAARIGNRTLEHFATQG